MKKRLLLMRHAKSSWDNSALSDHERPLNQRGYTEAPRIAEQLKAKKLVPSYVLSSDALRTKETWELMAPVFGQNIQVEFTNRLYAVSAPLVLQVIAGQPESRQELMLLGHNPSLEEVAGYLTGVPCSMGTAHMVILEIDQASWAQGAIAKGKWSLVAQLEP